MNETAATSQQRGTNGASQTCVHVQVTCVPSHAGRAAGTESAQMAERVEKTEHLVRRGHLLPPEAV